MVMLADGWPGGGRSRKRSKTGGNTLGAQAIFSISTTSDAPLTHKSGQNLVVHLLFIKVIALEKPEGRLSIYHALSPFNRRPRSGERPGRPWIVILVEKQATPHLVVLPLAQQRLLGQLTLVTACRPRHVAPAA